MQDLKFEAGISAPAPHDSAGRIMRCERRPSRAAIWRAVLIAALLMALPVNRADAQTDVPAAPEQTEVEAKKEQAQEALDTLVNLLSTRTGQEKLVDSLKKELQQAREEASKKELEEKIKSAQDKLSQLETQITSLSAGVADDSFSDQAAEKFDLRSELESLAEPIVKMLKSATSEARQIEKLRATYDEAKHQQGIAEKAVERLSELQAQNADAPKDVDHSKLKDHFAKLLADWKKRQKEQSDLANTAEQQLELRLTEQANAPSSVGTYATGFLRNRGLNLILALTAFFSVFTGLRLLGGAMLTLRQKRNIKPNFAIRLGGLLFKVFTVAASLFAMLFVLNMLNDWILLGLTSVFAVALSWIGLKMLPEIVEQTTLLLNLGAVQEGERVMLAGVPWRVERLDFHTDLVNPELEGGTFTLPVKELSGLHSRPAAVEEAWFPTSKGDWVQLKDGRVGRVMTQTPELVQIEELGGARVTYATSDFISEAPRNLSTGYRVEVVFGLDYRHQAEATDEIPRRLQRHVEEGLLRLLEEGALLSVQVDLLKAGESSIDYEVEADVAGAFAHRFEDVEREMSRLLVEACNLNGWTIPFPQLVVHRG